MADSKTFAPTAKVIPTIKPAVPAAVPAAIDYLALYQQKRNDYIAKFAGKVGMNPYLLISLRMSVIEDKLFNKKVDLNEAEKLLVRC